MKELSGGKARPRAVGDRNCHLTIAGEDVCVYPLDTLLDELAKRWTLLVIVALGDGPLRFNALESSLAGVSSRTLSERLKSLERRRLVHRRAYPTVPPHVEYRLTAKGERLLEALGPLLEWAVHENVG